LKKSKLIISVFNQALVSVFNFALTLYLIKQFSVADFGAYSLIFALGLSAMSFQNALLITPMSVRIKRRVTSGRSKYSRYYNTIFLVQLVVLIVASAAISSLLNVPIFAAAIYITGFCTREYAKSLLLLEFNVLRILLMDGLFFSITIGVIALIKYFQLGLTAHLVTATLGVSSIVAALGVSTKLDLGLKSADKQLLAFYRINTWKISKWSTIGVAITEIHSRTYLVLMQVFYSMHSVGVLQAARSLFGPMNLVINGWMRVSRNHLSSLIAQDELDKFKAYVKQSLLGVLIMNLAILLVIHAAWPWLNALLFSDKYEGIYTLVVLWGICLIILQLRTVITTALQPLYAFKQQTINNAIASITTFSSLFFILFFMDWHYVPVALILGELALFGLSLKCYLDIINDSNQYHRRNLHV